MKLKIKNRGIYYTILYDDEDHELINKYRWSLDKDLYVVGYLKGLANYKQKPVKMHRIIMKDQMNGLPELDHIFHNKQDNRKHKLRPCTHSQNHMNVIGKGKSKYLGVSYIRNRIRARIKVNGKEIYLGTFNTEESAAKAYDKNVVKYHGEFANLNFK